MRNKFLLATVVWAAFIAYACLAGASNIPKTAWLNIPYKDKVVHFIFYFIFTLLLYKDFKARMGNTKKTWLYAFVTAVSYGIIIEICQGLFTAERSPEVMDVLANACGSTLAIFMLWIRQSQKK